MRLARYAAITGDQLACDCLQIEGEERQIIQARDLDMNEAQLILFLA